MKEFAAIATHLVLGEIRSFMPHGMCYLWKPWLMGLHLISDGVIALSYFSIPFVLVYILRKRKDIPFNRIFWLFAGFILLCGIGHGFNIWIIWHPNYWISGWIRLLTALVSLAAAIALIIKIPEILTLPSPNQMQAINQQLQSKITQLEAAETELDRENSFLQALLDNLSDGIVACNANGLLTLFNKATKEFHGLPQQAIPAEEWATYYDLYLPDCQTIMPQDDIPLFKALQGESVRDVEMMIIPKQGKPRTLLANGDPIIDSRGKKIGAIATMRDITERKQAEQALAQLNNQLEEKVKERTAQLEEINTILLATTAALEQRNQELDQFAYVTSHDLKAPLRAIANLSQWIEEDLEDKLDEDTRHNMNLLRGRVHRLENLINGLLAYSRVGRLKSELQEVDVRVMLADIIDLLDAGDRFSIEIQDEMPIFVTELIPLQQVFTNLISNAIKHSDCDLGRIIISVLEQDNFYEFAVTDNGKGIAPKHHEQIFTIFRTLEARDTKESTGIGLAIVKKAVESQGGKVEVESQLGVGTTFRFRWQKINNY